MPLKSLLKGVASTNMRFKNERYGAIPVPVATMMISVSGLSSGKSITLPLGPVILTTVPGSASQRKLEQTPFLAGSSAFSSGHQYVARRTHSVVVLPVMSSPYLEEAMEYKRTLLGLPFLGLTPGGITP